MEVLELPQDIIWDGKQTPMLSPTHFSSASPEEILIFEDNFANGKCSWSIDEMSSDQCELIVIFYVSELIPNDDLVKPGQSIEIQFSAEEFEQLMDLQSSLAEMESDESTVSETNGKCKTCETKQKKSIFILNTRRLHSWITTELILFSCYKSALR